MSETKKTIVVPRCAETEIFENQDGDVVIRQVGWPDEDQNVIIPRRFLGDVWLRLRDLDEGKP